MKSLSPPPMPPSAASSASSRSIMRTRRSQTRLANALLWLLYISPQDLHGSPVCIVYDSGYAAGATQRTASVRSNVEAVALNRRLPAEVRRERRHGSVTFVHVKGHSDDPGNERADELVQWRKGKGPTKQQYKRLDIDGGLMIRELCEVL